MIPALGRGVRKNHTAICSQLCSKQQKAAPTLIWKPFLQNYWISELEVVCEIFHFAEEETGPESKDNCLKL